MSAITKTVFAQGVAILSARWNREIPAELAGVYLEAFLGVGLTGDEYIVGVKRATQDLDFFPSAKQIIDLARPEADASARAGGVFAAILRLREYHPTGSLLSLERIAGVLGEPARHAVVSIGGPSRLIGLTEDALPFVLRDFVKAFAEFDREERSRAMSDRLLDGPASRGVVGHEGERNRLGRPSSIGDVVRALPQPQPAQS